MESIKKKSTRLVYIYIHIYVFYVLYTVFLLTLHWARQLYCIENLHLSHYPISAAVIRSVTKQTKRMCNT